MAREHHNDTIKKKLTKRVIEEAEPKAERYHIQDIEIPGYALRVYPSGRKGYIVDYREQDSGRRRCITIGDAAIIEPDKARAKALEIRRQVSDGKSPVEERTSNREKPLFKAFVEEYFEWAKDEKKDSSIASDRSICKCHLTPEFGTRRVNSITKEDAVALHKSITKCSPTNKKPAPIAANHAIKLLSKMMNLCEDWQYRDKNTNPCTGFEFNEENKRTRHLNPNKELNQITGEEIGPGELERFLTACSAALHDPKESQRVIFLFLVVMATGARRGEIQHLRKSEVRINEGLIIKEDHKGRRKKQKNKPKDIDLNSLAIMLLRYALVNFSTPECDWVFESHKRHGKPYNNLHKPKERLLKRAGITDFTIHGMRHTFASLMSDSDASAELMMKLLGHSDFKTTQGYIHTFKKKKGESKAEAVSAAMQKFLSLPPLEIPPSNVINMAAAKKDTKTS